jgi:RNA polymerase primary sigma factor
LGKLISDGLSARNRLWESNCRLVASVARRYINKGMPFDDLLQEGNLGLEHAIVKFDWRKGFKFSTYAYWWIRQSVSRAISRQSRTVRLPLHTLEFMTRVFKASEELQQIHRSEVSTRQIAEYMGVGKELVDESFKIYYSPKSLDDSYWEDDDISAYDYIPGADVTEDVGEKRCLEHEISTKLLSKLTDRERRILELRYGIADGEEHTRAYVGNELGISRERVRQIETDVLIKLRSTAKREWFAEYL